MSDVPLSVPRHVDPARLKFLLEEAGWKLVGRREGSYYRLRDPGTRLSVVIPADQGAPDFSDLIDGAIRVLQSSYRDLWLRSIAPRLTTAPADTFRFRKESAAPSGLIPWADGQELIESAKATLLAGAKFYREPSRHFGNRFGQFANRYLDTILMGQTAPGSYIVTALAPAEAKVPLQASLTNKLGLEGIDIVSGREVTRSVATALEATVEAITHYRETTSFSAFDDGVRRGVSYEMSIAVRNIASDSDGAEILVEWHSPAQLIDERMETTRFEFSGADAVVLNAASVQLAGPNEREHHVARGRVHLLTKKQVGGPGVVGIDDGKRKFRVRLGSDEEYHEAVLAHDEEREVEVVGELAREGNINWLYDARLSRATLIQERGADSGTSDKATRGDRRLFGADDE